MKKRFLFFLLIIPLIFISGCKKDTDNKIVNFTYNYGSYNGGYYEYQIKKIDDIVTFVGRGRNGVSLNVNKEVDDSYLKKLEEIINKNGIKTWDGFNESDKNVLDGYSFSLTIEYKNGKTISAYGYMKEPIGYNKGHNALTKFLESIK